MLSFVAGYGFVFAVLCGVAVYSEADVGQIGLLAAADWSLAPLVSVLLALPVGVAWVTLEVANRVRPRRWLDHRFRRPVRLALLGVGAGLFAVIGCTLLLAWGEEYVPAWVTMPVCTVVAVGGAFLCMPPKPRGRCIHCGYDLSDGGLDGRCTECGSLDPL